MKITRRNVRSVVLLQSLLLSLSVFRISTTAALDEIGKDDATFSISKKHGDLDYNVALPHLKARLDEQQQLARTTTLETTSTITAPTPAATPTDTVQEEEVEEYTQEDYDSTPIADFSTDDSPSLSDSDTEPTFTTISSSIIKTTTSTASTPFLSSINKQSTVNNNKTTTLQYTNTSDPLVQYDLECRADNVICEKVSRAVGAAIDEFTRVVNIKNSLLIKVIYYSFCDKTCANDTMGWGTPTSQFTLPFEDGADLNYVYPQALAKQLAPYSSTSVWAKYDVEIELNHDIYLNGTTEYMDQALKEGWNGTGTPPNGKFWFFNDTGNSNTSSVIQPHQVDFRYVVLHELLHGLGFLSSWAAYFWTDASPFRELVQGVIDPLELQLVTPGPYWYINQDTGPAYVTGFQPTMIFDKYLVNVDTELNVTKTSSLSDLAFEMQDFCVQNNNAFIVNFIRAFNAANQSTTAHKLWISMAQPETISFQFQPPAVANSSYNLIPYLNTTYQNITLLTGGNVFARSHYEQTDATLNRPGLMISHLDDQYNTTLDFLMTEQYHLGKTLEDLAKQFYDTTPVIKYNTTAKNNTMVEMTYTSPIGPGILRILDSIGYSTVLTRTNYTTEGNVKTPKSRSICDDSNTNHGNKPTTPSSSSSMGNTLSSSSSTTILFITTFIISIYFIM